MPGDVSLTGIEFTIKGSADKASASIDKLIGNLTQLNTALSNSANLTKASTGLKSLGDALKGIGGLKALTASMALRELGNAAKSLEGFKSAASAIKSITKVSENPEALADAANWLSQISLIDFTNIEVAAQGIKDIAASTRSIGNIKPVNEEIKRTGEAAKKANKPLNNFVKSLGRIAFYRIIRSIIKSITEAFSEGLKNAYEFSKLTGGALSQALDTISTKSLTMKDQLGAAFGGLLTAITPAILTAINIITKLAAAITRLIAILGGNSQWMRAKDVWTEWGEEARAAGGAAKEALRYLAPFDELNRLPSDKQGGGGGANEPAYGDMFEWVSIEEGAGLADALKNAFDGVANFFENKDWAGLADSAWQGLKNAFSDTGKASEVIRSLFEALGAAIGAASAFVGEFCLNIAREVITKFKQNLVDYNGDGKVSIGEFLGAVFVSTVEMAQDIRNWVKTKIVDPFMDGFAKGIGMSGKEELHDSVVNFGIDMVNWFSQNVINPLITLWNNWVDTMPKWLQDAIAKMFGVDSLKIPLIGEIEHINTAGITASQKIIQNMVAGLTTVKDNIPSNKRYVNVVANYTSGNLDKTYMPPGGKGRRIPVVANYTSGVVDQSKMPVGSKSRTIFVTAHYNKAESKLTKAQTIIDAIARFYARERTDDFKKNWQTFDSIAKFNGRYDNLTEKQRTLISYADFKYRYDHLTDDKRTFTSTADFNTGRNNLTSYQTTFGSTARMDYLQDNLSTYQRTIAAIAGIGNYIIDNNLNYYGNLRVDAYLDIKGQANTPTVAVNAYYTNQVKARGGAYSGGVWRDIPQYASGGTPHGSMFVAGEAGPEIVGHIGGRTEVLNKSQIASAIYSATRSAMSNASMDNGVSEETMYRAFSRALADSDLGGDIELDGDTLYRAMVNRNRANTRMTGVNAMA